MKRYLLIAALAAVTFVASCNDDDNGNGNNGEEGFTVKVSSSEVTWPDGIPAIDQVRLVYEDNGRDRTLATADYDNGFNLTFPSTVDNNILSLLSLNEDEEGNSVKGITISKPGVLTTGLQNIAIDGYSGNTFVGDFFYVDIENVEEKEAGVEYVYVTEDVTVKGTINNISTIDGTNLTESIIKYDLDLKKGWNRVAWISEIAVNLDNHVYRFTWTTTVPTNLKWHFFE